MKVYLDHNATTPLDPQVLEAMLPYLREHYGNPSSIHSWGRAAKKALEEARETVAQILGASQKECVCFTGSGTEADNMAVKGVAYANRQKGKHIVTSAAEHQAVLNTCKALEKEGFEVTYVPVDESGRVNPHALANSLRPDTVLITVMHANNETGTVNPIAEIGQIARQHKITFHTDAVQSFCKLPYAVEELGVDLLSLSAHKIYGPKGVGALYIRRGTKMASLIQGGHHERNRRAGTENVAGIVGLAKAAEISFSLMEEETQREKRLRDKLELGLRQKIKFVRLNGHPTERLPNTLNMSFEFVEGESLILNLDLKGVAVSSGSACTSGSLEPSHVLLAMGIPHEICHGSLRFSLGRSTKEEEIDYVISILPGIVEQMRAMSPLYKA